MYEGGIWDLIAFVAADHFVYFNLTKRSIFKTSCSLLSGQALQKEDPNIIPF